MKVCFVSPGYARGGAELSLVELIDALSPRGIQCVCVLPRHGALYDLLDQRGVQTVIVPFKLWVHSGKTWMASARRKLTLARHVPAIARLARVIKRSRCDLVYTNSGTVAAGALAAKIVGKPHVWHMREFGYDDYQLSYDLGPRLSKQLMGTLSRVCIANSEAVAREYRPYLGETPLKVVYNAVEMPARCDALPADAPWRQTGAIRCLLLGKILPGKGQEDAVRAISLLAGMNVPAELLLVGSTLDEQYRGHLERIVQQHDLSDRVQLLSHTDNPLPLMNSVDVVLMCSHREAFGRVTVEGMKLGKPVIGTRSGGTPEILQDGVSGLLYTPGDAEELADKIRRLHMDRQARLAMGSKARQVAMQRFSQQKYGTNVEEILRGVVSRQDRPSESPGQLAPPSNTRAA